MKDLKDRTRNFSLRVIRLCAALPSNRTADVIAKQLLRSGTSPGAHFREALRARSKAEYVAKMNGGLMELEETLYWFEILEGSELMTPKMLESINGNERANRHLCLAHQQVEKKVKRSISAFCLQPSDFK